MLNPLIHPLYRRCPSEKYQSNQRERSNLTKQGKHLSMATLLLQSLGFFYPHPL
ncbi:MAG: Unknown protein [uncultured Thiotrichaceae bacterium]|uniref:Uncharacterized protein n=1 Tax=uncultured Thiotrichaceae bacterium TaxID=298394 RepID=A0A6S6TUN4_9GAMM|nr:MAG: Unknown protein [uncultured Thiotrichaceae bacterium]